MIRSLASVGNKNRDAHIRELIPSLLEKLFKSSRFEGG
jgi:hypothetical protein